jgi:CheY-like chemotaxis protein
VLAVPADQRRLEGRTVLIVEDHDDSRNALRLLIEAFGATVHDAKDGHRALAILAKETPDLILCDLLMPGLDGFALLKRLQNDERLCRTRAVAISGLGSDQDFKRTWAAGFNGHLVKPIDSEALHVVLDRVFWADRRPPG